MYEIHSTSCIYKYVLSIPYTRAGTGELTITRETDHNKGIDHNKGNIIIRYKVKVRHVVRTVRVLRYQDHSWGEVGIERD